MEHNVKFLIKALEGEVVSVNHDGLPHIKSLHRGTDIHRRSKLVVSFNPTSGKGSLGDCIVRPDNYKWGAFESGDGVVLMRFDWHVGWLFWAGTYANGKSIKPCVRFSDAIRYSKAKAMVALAVLNVDKKEIANGE